MSYMHFVASSKAARFPIETRTYTPLKKLLISAFDPEEGRDVNHIVAGEYTLVGGYFTRSSSIEGGTVSKTAYIADGVYIYESTDTYGSRICCPFGAGEFNITVNCEPVAISSSGSGKIFRGRTRHWLQRWLPAGSCVHC